MPIRTAGEYLKRWGFTPQKPVKKAYEQKPEIADRWLKTEYPQITQKAKKEKAEIYWGDETGIQNTANRTRGYAPKGTKPLIRVRAKKEHVSMISAINNEGKVLASKEPKGRRQSGSTKDFRITALSGLPSVLSQDHR
jgi:hypothetical protein